MEIKIKLNDEEYLFPKGITALEVSKRLKKDAIACRINGKQSDLTTVLDSCELELLDFEEARNIFWHSSAHILGCALTRLFDCKLLSGPPTENGFFYDIEYRPLTPEDIEKLKKEMAKIIKQKIPFKKTFHSKSELLNLFNNNPHKIKYIEKYVIQESSCYWIGDWYDFCEGPHVVDTSVVGCIDITNYGSIVVNEIPGVSFQRVSGISFPNKKMMEEHKKFIEIAKSLDHRKIGVQQELFFFNELSPGSCFFLPKGAHIYNKLMDYMRFLYKKNGYKEVITPNIYQTKLWEISGHLQNYKENMFMIEKGKDSLNQYALKPMNCPGHCLMFKSTDRSYRDLPLRLADFGVLHRNELTGTLSGLTRVRRFQQDDAHIFCTPDQIKDEVMNCINFLREVYEKFNFSFKIFLSTRPEKYIGTIQEWDSAEAKLKEALKGNKFYINEGDGAFYGPKIDIILKDAFKREIQCGTIQLDFQLPTRFELKYKDIVDYNKPVIIHRAILGSIERFIAILLENYGKKLPFWLSPYQIAIITIRPKNDANDYDEYLKNILERLKEFEIEVFDEELSINKRVLLAEKKGFNYIIFVGVKEFMSKTVDVRGVGSIKFDEFLMDIKEKVKNRMN